MSSSVHTFIAEQMKNLIVQRQTCTITGEQFPIYQSEYDFLQSIAPTRDGQRFEIPLPTLCPAERQRSIMAWRNDRSLYKKKSVLTDKFIMSYYHTDSPYRICESDIRWSDQVDNTSAGFLVDYSQTFTQQFDKLLKTAILKPLVMSNDNENCAFNNFIIG